MDKKKRIKDGLWVVEIEVGGMGKVYIDITMIWNGKKALAKERDEYFFNNWV